MQRESRYRDTLGHKRQTSAWETHVQSCCQQRVETPAFTHTAVGCSFHIPSMSQGSVFKILPLVPNHEKNSYSNLNRAITEFEGDLFHLDKSIKVHKHYEPHRTRDEWVK